MANGTPEGQVAIVTGAARGLGFAISTRLLDDGVGHVALFDRDAEGVHAATGRLNHRERSSTAAVDVADVQAVTEAVEAVAAAQGRIDVLVNCAGIFPHAPFEDLDLEEWRRVMATNLDGTFAMTSAVYPH